MRRKCLGQAVTPGRGSGVPVPALECPRLRRMDLPCLRHRPPVLPPLAPPATLVGKGDLPSQAAKQSAVSQLQQTFLARSKALVVRHQSAVVNLESVPACSSDAAFASASHSSAQGRKIPRKAGKFPHAETHLS